MSRALTIAWTQRNCPDPRVARDVRKQLDEAEKAGGHLLLFIGEKLTRSGTPYFVASLGCDMFALELSDRQARNMNLKPNVVGAMVRPGTLGLFAAEPPIVLADLRIENASAQNAAEPVVGQFTYDTAAPYLPDGFALRMVYDLPGGAAVRHFHYCAGPLPGRGTLPFRLSSLASPALPTGQRLPPTLPVILTLCRQRPGVVAPDVPVSNSYAALIDLR
jgi:hypothetical protein